MAPTARRRRRALVAALGNGLDGERVVRVRLEVLNARHGGRAARVDLLARLVLVHDVLDGLLAFELQRHAAILVARVGVGAVPQQILNDRRISIRLCKHTLSDKTFANGKRCASPVRHK